MSKAKEETDRLKSEHEAQLQTLKSEHSDKIKQLTDAHDGNTKIITAQLNEGLQIKYADDMNQVRGGMISEVNQIHQKYQTEIKGLKEIIGKEVDKEEAKRFQVEGLALGEAIRKLGGEVETKKEEVKLQKNQVEELKKEAAKQKKALEDTLA